MQPTVLIDLRDHFPPSDVELVVVGELQLVEPDANHGTDLHVHGLFLEGRGGEGRKVK